MELFNNSKPSLTKAINTVPIIKTYMYKPTWSLEFSEISENPRDFRKSTGNDMLSANPHDFCRGELGLIISGTQPREINMMVAKKDNSQHVTSNFLHAVMKLCMWKRNFCLLH